MGVSGKRTWAAVVAAAAAVLAFAAAPAGAAITHIEINDTFDGPGSIKAPCPDGTHVASGGMGTVNGYGGILLTGSYPYDAGDKDKAPDDGWKVDVINRGGLLVAANALCSDQNWKYASDDFKFPRFDDGTGTVACSSGTHIVGGGGRAGTMIGLLPGDGKDGDKLPDDKFTVHTESGATEKTKGTAYAVCGKAKPKYVTTKTTPITPHNEGGEFDAICPSGHDVLGGGAGINVGHRDGAINSLFPRVDSIQGWGTYLDNYDSAASHTGKVVAICEK
ncbi:MAG: hypothetical protein U0R51_03675 [Solirubrobacterales bacterium]